MNRILRASLAPAVLLFSAACVELDVTNPNNPDIARALASPADVENVASSSLNSWYLISTTYEHNLFLQVTADAATGNYGNWGMRFNNLEPRIPYNNSSAATDGEVARQPWNGNYGALGAANDALKAMAGGVVIPGTDGTDKARSAALFTQAASLMNLAMLFDRAFVVTEASTGLPTLVPYAEVRDSALAKWTALIALTAGKSWSWPATWLPLPVTATASVVNRIANTMAARTLVLTARTGAENTATNWAAVLAFADKGITGTGLADMDFSVVYDDNNWYDYIKLYGNLNDWTRVDSRLINRMAPNVPIKFTGAFVPPASNDLRLGIANLPCGSNPSACIGGLTNDYLYLQHVIGNPARGVYMQSPFYHRRWRSMSFAVPTASIIGTAVPYVLAAENDLMIAEALARTGGDLTRAAALVNKTRVTRGGLTAVAANQAAILAAVDYERDVELLNSNGLSLFDRRRIDDVNFQAGTPRQLPIPAKELEVLGMPIYTFGGA